VSRQRNRDGDRPEEILSNLHALPIACALTPGGLRQRLDAIQALSRDALLGHQRDGLELVLRYAPDAIERVRAMVSGEQHCCAFLAFEVREQPDAVHVTITAPEHARTAADELFEQFIAGVEPRR
jgi:hypothetical protein